ESEQFLNIKINILKASLGKSALLLTAPEDDMHAIVNLLHHLSLRETLQIMDLQTQETNLQHAIQLFGINKTLGTKNNNQPPMLEKLSDTGTLFINHAYLLDLETQNYLAEFMRTGYFRIFKNDQKIPSNVRLICSLHPNIQQLLQENILSKSFYNAFAHNTLVIPSLTTIPEYELSCLADRITEQIIQEDAFKNLLVLTEKDKQTLLQKKPTSLSEFKHKIHQIVVKKSKENNICNEAHVDPAYIIPDPNLAACARLGKHALKDQRMMAMLWHTFKNQNKIASLLGVNRSSVNRRCKEYNLIQTNRE
ncbi:MAG: sigma 54-interacting transcriptional regulator, partial [bacterium]|nr:sigma 54-interacting transcriptional regulator [bacterium]